MGLQIANRNNDRSHSMEGALESQVGDVCVGKWLNVKGCGCEWELNSLTMGSPN